MRWLRTGLTVLATALLIVLLAIMVLINTDLGRFKGKVETIAGDYLGREIAIGSLSIELGGSLEIAAQNTRLAGLNRAQAPDLISAQRILISIDTWSLLSGVLLIEDFQAESVNVHLEIGPEGDRNWTLALSESAPAGSSPANASSFPVRLNQARVSDLTLTYHSPEIETIRFLSSSVDLRESASGAMGFQIDGTLNETTVVASGSVGPMDNIVEGQDADFDLTGEIGEIQIKGTGHIDNLLEPRSSELELTVHGPNAEYVAQVLNIKPITSGPLELKAVMGPEDGATHARIEGTYGEFDIRLTADFVDLQSLDDLTVALQASGPNIATVARLLGRDNFPTLPFQVGANVRLSAETLTVERFSVGVGAANFEATATLPHFPGIASARLQAKIQGPEFDHFTGLLGMPGRLAGPFQVHATVTESDSEQSALDVTLAAQDIEGHLTGTLTSRTDLVGSDFKLELGGDDLSIIALALGFEPLPAEAFDAQATFMLGDKGINIRNGSATLGQDRFTFAGLVGNDAQQTKLQLTATLIEATSTLAAIGLKSEYIPAGTLRIDADLSRGDGAFLIEDLHATLGTARLQLTGTVADSLSFEDLQFDIDVRGESVTALLPLDLELLQDGAFRLVAHVDFSAADTMLLSGLEASFGGASARAQASIKLSTPDPDIAFSIDAEGPSVRTIVPTMTDYLPEADAFSLHSAGTWQGDNIRLQSTTFHLGDAELDVDGALTVQPDLVISAMRVSARLPALTSLQFLTDLSLPDDALSVQAVIDRTDEALRFSDLSLSLGQSKLTGAVSYEAETEVDGAPTFSVEFDAETLDLKSFQSALQSPNAVATSQAADGHLIPDTTVPFEILRRINGSFDWTTKQLVLRNADFQDVALRGVVRDGALQISQFELTSERGNLAGTAKIVPSINGASVSVNVAGSDLTLGFPAETEADLRLLPAYELTTQITTVGSTLRELASASNGSLRLVSDEGRIAFAEMAILEGDFLEEIVHIINPFAESESYSEVQCLAVLADVMDGIVTGSPAVVIQTDKLNITGVVTIDLSTEELTAKFHTQARQGLGIGVSDLLTPFTEFGGTLANPTVQLDNVGGVVEGFAKAGLSFIPDRVTDRLSSDQNPCRTAVRLADEESANREQ